MLAYNRHAASEIRERLRNLVGDEARFVTVSTIHSLAMRLVGASFAGTAAAENPDFDNLLMEAVRLSYRIKFGHLASWRLVLSALIDGYVVPGFHSIGSVLDHRIGRRYDVFRRSVVLGQKYRLCGVIFLELANVPDRSACK